MNSGFDGIRKELEGNSRGIRREMEWELNGLRKATDQRRECILHWRRG